MDAQIQHQEAPRTRLVRNGRVMLAGTQAGRRSRHEGREEEVVREREARVLEGWHKRGREGGRG